MNNLKLDLRYFYKKTEIKNLRTRTKKKLKEIISVYISQK